MHKFGARGVHFDADPKGGTPPADETAVKAKAEEEAKAKAKAEEEAKRKAPEQPDFSKLSLEDIAKVNPAVAEILKVKQEAEQKLKEYAEAEEARRVEEEKKKGNHEALLSEASQKLKERDGEIGKLKEALKDRDAVIESVLSKALESIPKDRHSLIPAEYGPAKKLDYIMQNAAALGAQTVLSKGGPVPTSDNPPLDDEAKLVAEVNELLKKTNKTPSEYTLLWEKTRKLKELRAAKENKEKQQ